jgi:hypothetical protein
MVSSKLKIALASVMSIGFPSLLLAAAAGTGPDGARDVIATDDGWAAAPGATLPLGTTGG